jgi:hypothetical protein
LQNVPGSAAVIKSTVTFMSYVPLFSHVLRILGGDVVMKQMPKVAGIKTRFEAVTVPTLPPNSKRNP